MFAHFHVSRLASSLLLLFCIWRVNIRCDFILTLKPASARWERTSRNDQRAANETTGEMMQKRWTQLTHAHDMHVFKLISYPVDFVRMFLRGSYGRSAECSLPLGPSAAGVLSLATHIHTSPSLFLCFSHLQSQRCERCQVQINLQLCEMLTGDCVLRSSALRYIRQCSAWASEYSDKFVKQNSNIRLAIWSKCDWVVFFNFF